MNIVHVWKSWYHSLLEKKYLQRNETCLEILENFQNAPLDDLNQVSLFLQHKYK